MSLNLFQDKDRNQVFDMISFQLESRQGDINHRACFALLVALFLARIIAVLGDFWLLVDGLVKKEYVVCLLVVAFLCKTPRTQVNAKFF